MALRATSAVLTTPAALDRVRRRALAIDARETRLGLPPLACQDKTDRDRHRDVLLALAHVLDGPAELVRLETAAAYLVGWMLAVDARELAAVESGSEAG